MKTENKNMKARYPCSVGRSTMLVLSLLAGAAVVASCNLLTLTPTPAANMPNPASALCEQEGNRLELRTADDGSQMGVCAFPDGSWCEEWAYFRGECLPGMSLTPQAPAGPTETADPNLASDGCKIYRNEELGYSFHYPAEAEIETGQDPLLGISIAGPLVNGESWPAIYIAHPGDREEFLPPEDADLEQWLTDHDLVGEQRAPDVLVAGELAVHYRHERSPQSYASDRYFFAKEGQLYSIVLLHTGDREDWGLYSHFLDSLRFIER
jgi:putative hemolysin